MYHKCSAILELCGVVGGDKDRFSCPRVVKAVSVLGMQVAVKTNPCYVQE